MESLSKQFDSKSGYCDGTVNCILELQSLKEMEDSCCDLFLFCLMRGKKPLNASKCRTEMMDGI